MDPIATNAVPLPPGMGPPGMRPSEIGGYCLLSTLHSIFFSSVLSKKDNFLFVVVLSPPRCFLFPFFVFHARSGGSARSASPVGRLIPDASKSSKVEHVEKGPISRRQR